MQICKKCGHALSDEETEAPPKNLFKQMQIGSIFVVGEQGQLIKVDKKPDNVDVCLIASA